MSGIAMPTFFERGFSELKKDVIDRGLCSFCGACIAFCPRIGTSDEAPEIMEYDPLCGMCYAFCPKTFFPKEEIEEKIFGKKKRDRNFGIYEECVAARSKDEEILKNAQDGGVVTALIAFALENDIIDGVVATKSDEKWMPEPVVVSDKKELLSTAGTKYTLSPTITGIKKAIDDGFEKIGVIGTPCQIQAIRKIQTSEEPYQIGKEKIKLCIGLFCMESFGYDLITDFMKKLGVDPEKIEKFSIKKGKMWIRSKEETHVLSLKELEKYAKRACSFCSDFTAELADISVGSVGSPDRWSTIFVRSDLGRKLFKEAEKKGCIESKPIERLDPIKKLCEMKKERAEKSMN
ncbi:MAG: Coenzyme F420 hydrogenase/dehydrogenase, beta subunit C-terminal domain [Candidatus Syntropharchaeia archaeon]